MDRGGQGGAVGGGVGGGGEEMRFVPDEFA